MLYPWNAICNYLIRHGKVEYKISGLEDVELDRILSQTATTMIRDIQMQIDNPDMSDSEKVSYIRNTLAGFATSERE